MKTYKWLGPSGYNPLVGYVAHDKTFNLASEEIVEKLLNAALIEPFESSTPIKEDNERREEETGEAVDEESGSSGEDYE